jgi:hypothetical protein
MNASRFELLAAGIARPRGAKTVAYRHTMTNGPAESNSQASDGRYRFALPGDASHPVLNSTRLEVVPRRRANGRDFSIELLGHAADGFRLTANFSEMFHKWMPLLNGKQLFD